MTHKRLANYQQIYWTNFKGMFAGKLYGRFVRMEYGNGGRTENFMELIKIIVSRLLLGYRD